MLKGAFGQDKKIALMKIIEFAEALGAEELCPVTKATYPTGLKRWTYFTGTDSYDDTYGRFFLGKPLDEGQFDENCLGMNDAEAHADYDWQSVGCSKEFFDRAVEFMDGACSHGSVRGSTCTPYLSGWVPVMGEHFVTTESSNVLFCNSVWGAMGNCGGTESTYWSLICGRTPLWGNHIKENRYATHLFKLECPAETIHDWNLIGHAMGRKMPTNARPVIVGDFPRPHVEHLKQCFSAMATTSSAEICHIVGVTPEAQTLEMALGGHQSEGTFVITQADFDESIDYLCAKGSGPVGYVSLGCPHMTIEEVRTVARYLEGKKVHGGVKLHLWMGLSTLRMAEDSDFAAAIREAGGILVTASCPMNTADGCMCGKREYKTSVVVEGAPGVAFDSAKQAHYLKSELKMPIYYGDVYRCLDAAVAGRWEEK